MSDNDWTPVTPIPVSEPPGDQDIVLLCCDCGDGEAPDLLDFDFDFQPRKWWRAKRYLEFPNTRHGEGLIGATHYLLLRKGE